MPWHNLALELAGFIGAAVAIAHGVLVQRLIVRPFAEETQGNRKFSATVRRLVPPLIHFSTIVWFAGGIALASATVLGAQTRLAISIAVGVTYLFAAIGNVWATRGLHPGWILMTVALLLIAFGAVAPSPQV